LRRPQTTTTTHKEQPSTKRPEKWGKGVAKKEVLSKWTHLPKKKKGRREKMDQVEPGVLSTCALLPEERKKKKGRRRG
jgi:hypothetical protein